MTSLPQRSFFNRGAKEEGKKTEEPKTNDTPKKRTSKRKQPRLGPVIQRRKQILQRKM